MTHPTKETVNTKVSLGFDQRMRASQLEESIYDDELAAAYEIVFLRDRLANMTRWLESNQPTSSRVDFGKLSR